ncbi:MAG: hypothetical protein H0V01_12270 [Bacteroidetes bacterium]|nr:hypothetical protein [Bacteroidota bacterium]HET6245835.1 hypothetical protein [Bacteroidia bacterium]
MYDILKKFEDKYVNLKKKGMQVEGLLLIDPKRKKHVISISRPFVFDNRNLPKRYETLEIKSKIQGELPQEFKINRENPDWQKTEFIWAPERFEHFVDRCSTEIRKKLDQPEMSRNEMLDALCFGNFQEHKAKCEAMVKEGKIPAFKNNAKEKLELVN